MIAGRGAFTLEFGHYETAPAKCQSELAAQWKPQASAALQADQTVLPFKYPHRMEKKENVMRSLAHPFRLAALLLICSAAGAQDTGEILRGEVLASTCFSCHGTDGKSAGSIPAINGIPADSLRRSLHEFRDGRRPATVMDRHAKAYSDEEIASIADYLSRIK